MEEKDIKIDWKIFSLLLIPLCFFVYTIVNFNDELASNWGGASAVFVLIFFSYSNPFFSRRIGQPTIFTLVGYYVISLIGSGLIAYSGDIPWIVLVVILLRFIDNYTTLATEYGIEISSKIEEEEKDRKWFKKIIATPSQQEINGKGIIDYIIFFIVIIGFFFLLDEFMQRYNNRSIIEQHESCISTKYMKFEGSDKIEVAKCYDKGNLLKYIDYYNKDASLDEKYFFRDGELSSFEYYANKNSKHWVTYRFEDIKKTDETYMFEGKQYNYYRGVMISFDPSGKIRDKTEVKISYKENKYTSYIRDGLEISYNSKGEAYTDMGREFRDGTFYDTKILTDSDRKRIGIN